MRTLKPLLTALGAAALLAATAVPAAAQDSDATDLQARVDEFVGLLPGGVAVITIKDGVRESAAAGIADPDGTPFGIDTPILIGGAATIPLYGLALQLVEEGLIDLDEPVTTYLPEAPVADGATLRDLLTFRAGVPLPPDASADAVLDDPERIFTRDDLLRGMDRADIRPLGEFADGLGTTLVVAQLVEAVTGSDAGTALAERITEPLGMAATRRADGDPEAIGEVSGGWTTLDGEPVYLPNTSNASRSFRPTVTTAEDMATYVAALVAGEVVSPELLASTVFDAGVEVLAYGLLRPDGPFIEDLALSADSDAGWFGIFSYAHTGATGVAAVAPDTGDVLVVVANSEDLDSTDLALEIVADWDAGPSAALVTSPAQGTLRYAYLSLCDDGQTIGLEVDACSSDEEGVYAEFHAPFEVTGTLEGIGSLRGAVIRRSDGTFRGAAGDGTGTAIFMGEVEGCGTGTVHFSVVGEGFYAEEQGLRGTRLPTYTRNTWEVIPGGTLPVSGSLEGLGEEYVVDDHSTAFDFVGELTCRHAAG